MKMNILVLAALLVGCKTGEVRKHSEIITPAPPPAIVAPVTLTKKEVERLTKACRIPEVPTDLKGRDVRDVAVDLANARKAALEECAERMAELRHKLRKAE